MKKIIIIVMFAIALLVCSSPVHALVPPTTPFNISYVGQDPSPAVPGKYVDITFKVRGGATYSPTDVTFEIVEKFPFSLEPGAMKVQNLGNIKVIGRASEENEILFQIRLLVDGRAIDGDNELEYKYYISAYEFSQKINIKVSNVQTDFDVVVQEVSVNAVSLGIVNTGENSAKSIVVEISDQQYFKTENVNSNIIGNLASGDFTIATFNVIPVTNQRNELKVAVSYTDTEGTRHFLEKSVLIQLNPVAANATQKKQSALGSPILTIILILIIIVLAYFAFFKKKK